MTTHNDPDLAQRLVVRAAHKAPPALCERLEEEWLADLQSRSGFARLRLAFGCCWATTVIMRDFRVPQLAASGTTGTHRLALGVPHYDLPLLSRRTVTLLVIAGLHALVIYGFASGFAQKVAAALPEYTHVIMVENHSLPPPPPPVPQVKLEAVRFTDPVVDVPPLVDVKHDDGATVIISEPPRTHDTPVAAPVIRVTGGPGKGFPATADYYPDASRRISETGASIVQVCVDPQGRVTGDPMLAQSSGSRRIDEAALKLARAGSGHYRPSTENGQPVSACYAFRIRFELND